MSSTDKITISIKNYDDYMNFLIKLEQIPEYQKLSSDEKEKIIKSYPIKFERKKEDALIIKERPPLPPFPKPRYIKESFSLF